MYKTYRLIAQHIRDNIAEILWIDRDKGQLEKPENFHSIIVPGVLVDFDTVNWKGQTRSNQEGEGQVTLKLVFRLPVSSHETADWNDHPEFEFLSDRLYEVASTHTCIGSRRTSRDYFTGAFYVYEQTFDLILYQTEAVKTWPKPPPKIEGALSHTLNIPK